MRRSSVGRDRGTPTYDFTDETVVVTDASSGIGRATALAFADAGATVLNADVREAPKDTDASTPTHALVEKRGGTAEYLETDVGDPAQVEAVVDHASEYGGVDVMVNTASISSDLAQGGSVHYEATKGAVRMITRGAALEYADVAAAFLWLASDAAAYTTGELLHVDGGWQVC